MRTPSFQQHTDFSQAPPEPTMQFVDWMLLDLATRPTSGKNPEMALDGLWMGYFDPASKSRGKGGVRTGRAYVHRSDLSLRKYVAILKLKELGMLVEKASVVVGTRLGHTTAKEFTKIRKGFYKFHPPGPDEQLLRIWEGMFATWRVWAAEANQVTIDCAIHLMLARGRGAPEVRKFRDLVRRIKEEYKGPWCSWPRADGEPILNHGISFVTIDGAVCLKLFGGLTILDLVPSHIRIPKSFLLLTLHGGNSTDQTGQTSSKPQQIHRERTV
jgi:hypothetical protein